MTRVMGVDAGQSTGICVIEFAEGKAPQRLHVEQFETYRIDAARQVLWTAEEWEVDVIAAERFDLRPQEFVADLTTVYINAIIENAYYEQPETRALLVWQTPGQAKGLVSNQVLKNLDFWITGKPLGTPDADDARDAERHAVYYGVMGIHHDPTIEKGWPNT